MCDQFDTRMDHVRQVIAHQRLAARHLDNDRLQLLHVAAVVGRLHVARHVTQAPVVAVLAEARARVGDFERHHDGTIGPPVQGTLTDDLERLPQRDLAHKLEIVPDNAVFRKPIVSGKRSEINGFRATRGRCSRSTGFSARSGSVAPVQGRFRSGPMR
jgi:hypothetical protein